METTMDNDWIAHAGKALFGEERWLTPLGAAMGIGDRNLRRVLSGDDRPPPGFEAKLRQLLERRRAAIDAAIASLPAP
jgi:hypothetical protein